jgi:hypothetical protein
MLTPYHRYRCALGKVQPHSMDTDAVKEQGWRQHRILVVSEADERLDFVEREFVRRLGDRLYGREGGGDA